MICFDAEDPALSDIEIVAITVVATNQPPVLDPIGPQTVTEGNTLEFNIYATDVDGPSIVSDGHESARKRDFCRFA